MSCHFSPSEKMVQHINGRTISMWRALKQIREVSILIESQGCLNTIANLKLHPTFSDLISFFVVKCRLSSWDHHLNHSSTNSTHLYVYYIIITIASTISGKNHTQYSYMNALTFINRNGTINIPEIHFISNIILFLFIL